VIRSGRRVFQPPDPRRLPRRPAHPRRRDHPGERGPCRSTPGEMHGPQEEREEEDHEAGRNARQASRWPAIRLTDDWPEAAAASATSSGAAAAPPRSRSACPGAGPLAVARDVGVGGPGLTRLRAGGRRLPGIGAGWAAASPACGRGRRRLTGKWAGGRRLTGQRNGGGRGTGLRLERQVDLLGHPEAQGPSPPGRSPCLPAAPTRHRWNRHR